MSNTPKDPKDKSKKSGASSDATDFEKTMLDVDIRSLEKEEAQEPQNSETSKKPASKSEKGSEKADKGMKAALDETLIFEMPPLDDEDTDLHRLKKKKEIEERLAQEEGVKVQEELQKKEVNLSTKFPEETKKESSKVSSSEGAKNLWKEFTSFTALEPPPQSRFAKFTEFVAGLVLLLALLDVCIEGLALGSPLSAVSIGVTILCVLVNIYFIIRKGNFHAGLELSLWAFLGLLGYSTWKYGAYDASSFSLLKLSPAQIYNEVFLGVLLIVLFVVWQNKKASVLIKAVLTLLIVYGSAGYLENIFAVVFAKRVWNLEDTLYGTELWKWLPFYYFRPVVFSFWILFPVLTLYFLFQKVKAVFSKEKIFARESTLALGLLFLSFALGNLILFKNNYPSIFGFILHSENGWGQTRAWTYTPSGNNEDYDIDISTIAPGSDKNDDSLPVYKMGALFIPQADSKKLINLSLRAQGGAELPFFKSTDLAVLQEQVQQKPIKLRMREESFFERKSLVLLIDRSFSMASYLSYVDKASRSVFEMLNSRENLFWSPFSETTQPVLVKNLKNLQKNASALSAQGSRNLGNAFDKSLATLKGQKGQRIILMILSSDPVSEDYSGRYLSTLKSEKIKLYGVNFGESVPESLRALADGSGGKWVSVKNPPNLAFALRSLLGDALGQYQISYEGQSFSPKFTILSPQNGDEVSKDAALQLKIQNYQDVKLSAARLYMDDKLLQEIPVQNQDLAFPLNVSQLPKGSHLFKVSLVGEGGKEFTQDLKLNITSGADFAFIRPLEGDVVSGQVNLEVYYKSQGPNSLQKVEFLVDGQKVGEASSEPYILTWDTQGLQGGHTIQALATFADASTKSDQIKVNVVGNFAVHILSPSVGEFLNNLTEVEADVSHNLSEIINKVEFWVDGALLGEVTQAPYKYLWDNSELASGRHVLQARAYTSNNWASTDAVIVNIGNGGLSVQLEDGNVSYLAPDYIEWVVDASSSMSGEVGGIRKIDIVKQSLIDMFPKLPSSSQFALRSYGASGLATHRDCRDTVLDYPLKNLDSQKMVNSLNLIEPQGVSPLAYTLDKIKGDFKTAYGTRVLILFTDGFDNCGGDPVGQLEKWKKEKLNIKLYILGLDIEGTRVETELKRLASIVGGQYYPVKNEKEILAALEEMIKVTYRVFDYKGREVAQKPIGAAGLSLRTGEYRLEVDLEPPLVKEKVLINNGVEKKVLIKKDGSTYSFVE